MKLDWITDPHMTSFENPEYMTSFLKRLGNRKSDGLLVTGDITESSHLEEMLRYLGLVYKKPVYFVLGNHDYFGDYMTNTWEKARKACREQSNLHWMNDAGVVYLNDNTALVGHDGWYCGQEGLGKFSPHWMMDFRHPLGVEDLLDVCHDTKALFERFKELAKASAEHVNKHARIAFEKGVSRLLIMTHVPPFRAASKYQGKVCDDVGAPFYVNRVLGECIQELSEDFPDRVVSVYAGHTHNKTIYVSDNVTVHVGAARYGHSVVFQTPILIS
jgi:3',5'-cyclic-AMP phosphodiesterase